MTVMFVTSGISYQTTRLDELSEGDGTGEMKTMHQREDEPTD